MRRLAARTHLSNGLLREAVALLSLNHEHGTPCVPDDLQFNGPACMVFCLFLLVFIARRWKEL